MIHDLKEELLGRQVWLAASTHVEEESGLDFSFKTLRFCSMYTIIAPLPSVSFPDTVYHLVDGHSRDRV